MEIWEASATLAFIPIMILTRFVMIIGKMENAMLIVFFSCHDIDTFVVLILMMVVVVMENIMMTSSLSLL